MQKFFVNLNKIDIYMGMLGYFTSEVYRHFFNINPYTDFFIRIYNLFLHIFN
jgi:hypothetical protein